MRKAAPSEGDTSGTETFYRASFAISLYDKPRRPSRLARSAQNRDLTCRRRFAFFPADQMNLNGTTTSVSALAHSSVVAVSVVSVSVVTDAPRGS